MLSPMPLFLNSSFSFCFFVALLRIANQLRITNDSGVQELWSQISSGSSEEQVVLDDWKERTYISTCPCVYGRRPGPTDLRGSWFSAKRTKWTPTHLAAALEVPDDDQPV
ncbi:hypothetical protein B0H14DRAFT_2704497 [Mycena olivaceomarginata]|nr:hypothetical protein B0H14DRAFT_2704497 [Mycena olivaceomarginata]